MCFFHLSASIYYYIDYYAYINAESVLNFFENVPCIDHVNGSSALVTNTVFLFSDCKQINVEHAIIDPTGTVTNGSIVTVTCESGYTLDSTGITSTTVTCVNGQLDVTPTCSAGLYIISWIIISTQALLLSLLFSPFSSKLGA